MFNATQILNQLVQAAQGMVAPATAGAASSQQNAGTTVLGGLLNNPAVTGALSGVGGGILAGLLFGNKGSNIGGKLVTIGGAAALGTLAFKAFRNWQANSSAASQNVNQPSQEQPALEYNNLSAEKQEDHSRVMLTAFIAAAKADGQFDEREQQMVQKLTDQAGDPETAAWVQQEISKQLDADQVAALATSPELAAEIYLASLIVIDDQNEQEKKYLDSLAEKMNLEPQLRQEIEQQLAARTQ